MCYDDNDDARCQREIFVKMIAPKVANHVSLKNFFKDAVQLYSSEHKGCTFALNEGKVLHRLSHFGYPDLNIDFRNVLYAYKIRKMQTFKYNFRLIIQPSIKELGTVQACVTEVTVWQSPRDLSAPRWRKTL